MKGLFAILAMATVGPAFVSAQSRTHCICQNGPQAHDGGPLNANNGATEKACHRWGGPSYLENFPRYTQDDDKEFCTDNTCIDEPTFARYCNDNGARYPPKCWDTNCNPNGKK